MLLSDVIALNRSIECVMTNIFILENIVSLGETRDEKVRVLLDRYFIFVSCGSDKSSPFQIIFRVYSSVVLLHHCDR